MELIELARRADAAEWTAERRDRIYQQVLARAEKERERRRVMRTFAAGASALALIGLLLS
jgi:hypothetical protein